MITIFMRHHSAFIVILATAGLTVQARAEAPERVETLVVYGDDPCPPSSDGAIVVCARKPESERYRIPKTLRDKKAVVGSQGWASRVETMENSGRQLLPNSCSVIGTNGQTGCTQAMLRQWFDEKRLAKQQEEGVP